MRLKNNCKKLHTWIMKAPNEKKRKRRKMKLRWLVNLSLIPYLIITMYFSFCYLKKKFHPLYDQTMGTNAILYFMRYLSLLGKSPFEMKR
jgi:hypothetical protein